MRRHDWQLDWDEDRDGRCRGPAPRTDARRPAVALADESEGGLHLTGHGRTRCAQRSLGLAQLSYVLNHGRCIQRTGVSFVFLGARDIPQIDRRCDWRSKLRGTVAIVGADGAIITAYRHQRALATIRRKMKYRLPFRAMAAAVAG